MKLLILISTLFLLITLQGCQVFDKPEEIPSFVKIDDITLETTTFEGTSSSKFTDVWVYVNDNFEGVWELPALIPLHYQGNQNVKFYAGVKKNGIAAERDKYPFLEPFELNMNLIGDSIIELSPIVKYEENLNIWIEDFEDPGIKFNTFSSSDTTMFVVSDPPYSYLFEGDAGAIMMNENTSYCEMRTNELDFNNFPQNISVPAYMELNYKCNYNFEVGILHKDDGLPYFAREPLITLYPTTDDNGIAQWNKTYLYITDVSNFYPLANEFDLYISVLNSTSSNNIEVYFDNIKVIQR